MQRDAKKPLSKSQIQRIKRKGNKSGHSSDDGELTFLWAISYSDMLMVLMSFFIIFFSLSENMKSSTLKELQVSLQDQAGVEKKSFGTNPDPKTCGFTDGFLGKCKANKDQNEEQFGTGQREIAQVQEGQKGDQKLVGIDHALKGKTETQEVSFIDLKELRNKMNSNQTNLTQNKENGIMIDFPDAFFEPGSFELTKKSQEQLDKVLMSIKPYEGKVYLVFIGHTDEDPLQRSKNRILKDNLVLSTLRATSAVQHAIEMGFQAQTLSSQGVAEYVRNSRTLSLKVWEKRS